MRRHLQLHHAVSLSTQHRDRGEHVELLSEDLAGQAHLLALSHALGTNGRLNHHPRVITPIVDQARQRRPVAQRVPDRQRAVSSALRTRRSEPFGMHRRSPKPGGRHPRRASRQMQGGSRDARPSPLSRHQREVNILAPLAGAILESSVDVVLLASCMLPEIRTFARRSS